MTSAAGGRTLTVQSTLPRGERRQPCLRGRLADIISIHAPAWGATAAPVETAPTPRISIHAPAWGATTWRSMTRSICCNFNPRSRVGSDTIDEAVLKTLAEFQSTLPRGERRPTCPDARSTRKISIHAPAWGATKLHGRSGGSSGNFNPRSRVGSDFFICHSFLPRYISIHAPAWGATLSGIGQPPSGRNFNPRSRVGSDFHARGHTRHGLRFQSTLPRGERRKRWRQTWGRCRISIHAPAWGATTLHASLPAENREFQSTLPRGERPGAPGTLYATG